MSGDARLAGLANRELVAEYERLDARADAIMEQLLDEGHEHLRPRDMRRCPGVHPLAPEFTSAVNRMGALRGEAESRCGRSLLSIKDILQEMGPSYRRRK